MSDAVHDVLRFSTLFAQRRLLPSDEEVYLSACRRIADSYERLSREQEIPVSILNFIMFCKDQLKHAEKRKMPKSDDDEDHV